MVENLKRKLIKLKEKCNKIYSKWKEYAYNSFGDTQKGLCIMSTLVLIATVGECISNFFPNRRIGFVIGAIIGGIAVKVVLWIATVLLKFFLRNGEKNFIYATVMGATLLWLAMMGSINAGRLGNVIYALIVFLALGFLAKGLWAFAVNLKRNIVVYVSMGVSGVIVVVFVIMMVGKGFLDKYVPEYIEKNKQVELSTQIDGFESYLEEGSYEVASFEYSPEGEKDILTHSVDLTKYVDEEEWYYGLYRSLYQSYTLDKAPVAGKVWYPKNGKKCPVVFIIHGNHNINTPSYLGYDYLGEYLASHGYVFVSVDENVLNLRSNENDGRAVLLLENIKTVESFNLDKNNPLYGMMDLENIALMGHSRGGESIATAYLFNSMSEYPSNGSFKFDYNFNIKSLIAIAPSNAQYKPAGHQVELENVNYLLLQGANDQDVSTFMGNVQYENVSFTDNEEYIKSSLYIAGANHGQFNSKWGLYDLSYPFTRWYNVGNFIKSKEQKSILKMYSKVFLDKTLGKNDTYGDLLTDYAKYSKYLPETVYIQQYNTSAFQCISDFEEDSNLKTASDTETSIYTGKMSIWTEEMLFFSSESFYSEKDNHALFLKWDEGLEPDVTFSFKRAKNLKDSAIQFDICDINEDNIEEVKNMDMTIVLLDTYGNEISANMNKFVTVYPPLPVKLSKVQYLSNQSEYKKCFQTVNIPVSQFEKKGDKFDYKNIIRLKFIFGDDEGKVNIDNVGIVK